MEVIRVELIDDREKMLRSGVWKDEDCGEGVLEYGVDSLVRQSSTSPVAPECAIDDDSNGSIARDRFNLVVLR